ncbi:amino acid-binding protein [Hoeflea sp. BAL378]|uniref:ACT domain-containing protein n=1 Tax=Hoeflea sp. BAL378 TaxID=1547437 RepID=UPI000512AFD3|nr:ACT domain-containing protein [Hoeflea sp. BAL378]KGF66973.1 amino acid-binding protein [Hoeflea sp. BAL378]
MAVSLTLKVVPGSYGIARLDPQAAPPAWAGGEGFWALIRADDEITVVCLQDRIPGHIQSDRGWACLRTVGPFAFDATGIVSALIAPLSDDHIGVFVVCTFDGEHLLLSERDLDRSMALLEANGHRFLG